MVIWSVRFSAPDLSTVQQSLRTTSIFSIGLITVLVTSRSLPAMATDGEDLTLNDDGKGAHRLAMARKGKAYQKRATIA